MNVVDLSTGDDGRTRLPTASGRVMLTELRQLAAGRGRAIAGMLTVLLVAAGLGLVLPLTVGWIVDTVAEHSGDGLPTTFWWQLGLLAGCMLLAGAFEFAGTVVLAHVAETMIAQLRERFVATVLRMPQQVVETVGTGDIVSRASSDIREISNSVPRVLPELCAATFTIGLSAIGMVLIDWRFALGLLLSVPLYLLALRWYLREAPPVYTAHRAAEGIRSQHVLATINALPTVTAYRLENARLRLIRDATWELVRWAMRARIVQNRLFGRINLAEGAGLLIVLSLGFVLTDANYTSVGQVTAAALLYFRIVAPISTLMFVMDNLQSAAASLARVVGAIRSPAAAGAEAPPPGIPAPGSPGIPAPGAEADSDGPLVRLDGVRFGYRADHPVLDGIDIAVHEGEHIALVGATGSGKTTLARLIAGTHTPQHGDVRHRIETRRIAYLSQEHHVFAGTLRENLSLARPDADDDRLRWALQEVGAQNLLQTLTDGLDTVLGLHGHRVTAAQAQHVALARLLLHDPVLAILDEATAEANSHDAALLDEATTRTLRDRTAIVIAHRLNQAVDCDRIVVLHRGRISEEGTHADLLGRGGRYAHLWDAWNRSAAPMVRLADG